MSALNCLSSRCRDVQEGRPRPAPGSRLCGRCGDKLGRDLAELPRLHRDLLYALSAPERSGEKVRATGYPGIPFNDRAARVRGQVVGVLASWAELVVQERGVRPPARDAQALAAFLLRHHDWLGGHEAAGDWADEVAELISACRRVITPQVIRMVPIGACVAPGCPGELNAGAQSTIRCTADPTHVWGPRNWSELRRRLERVSA